MYLISVYFDDKTNRVLQRYIDSIAKVTGNRFMIDHKVPPHMTLSAIEARSVDVLLLAFQSMRLEKAGDIQFVTVGQLLPYVFYAAPVLNAYLLNLSSVVYDAYKVYRIRA